ncbi:restriction endonuclease subunit S [Methanoculleus bourgensis]|uniref:Type I restriction-modification system specificity subunit n=1 Tax=Methanoculleus bourgensis TaxID=83986 RepID=A0A0X3BMQ0_9EURY|nr:restriction endonuclease subunit S [Methanoculleus bourgensis]CVK33261.1 Type I restriction-modification system specificity subunit [Methanoculleus bourgensis]
MPERSEVPEGWERTSLKDVLTINYGKGLKKDDRVGETYSVYGSNGVVGHHREAITEGPTIIIGRKGSVGEVNYSPQPCWPIDTTYYVDSFSEMNVSFIFYLLKTLQLAKFDTSTAIPGINRNDIYSQEIPLPPLAEQHRIVAAIEALFARLDAANARLERVPGILKQFRQSVLATACDGRLTEDWRAENPEVHVLIDTLNEICGSKQRRYKDEPEESEKYQNEKFQNLKTLKSDCGSDRSVRIPEHWTWLLLPTIGHMHRGTSKHRPRNDPSLFGGDYPFIQTGEIAQSKGRIVSHSNTYNEKGLAQSKLWPKGTVCITIAANIANSAILTYPACFPDSVVGIIPTKDVCTSEYLEYFFRTVKDNLSQFAPATAQKNINIGILNDVAIPLPPFREQHEIVRRVDALFALADRIEAKVAAAREKTETMRQSILAQAFSGRLVPTEAELARQEGREYEPASVLLERIRSEKKEKKGRKGVQSTLV